MSLASINLETIKLHLVHNKSLPSVAEQVSLTELIEYLIESLEEADNTNAVKVENLLLRIGRPTVPYLLKGLKSSDTKIKSVCTMTLIRMGETVSADLKAFYLRHMIHSKHRWVGEFILNELCEEIPEADVMTLPLQEEKKVVTLTHVG